MRTTPHTVCLMIFVLLLLLLAGCQTTDIPIQSVISDSTSTGTEVITDTAPPEPDTTEPLVTETVSESIPPQITEPSHEVTMQPEETEAPVEEPIATPIQIRFTVSGQLTRYDYSPCTVEIEDPSGEYSAISDSNAEIKVRGHSTSTAEKSPYNFKFSGKRDFLDLGSGKKWALLANLFDRTQMRNHLALDFARTIGLDNTSEARYAEVYINDEYSGLYLLCEPIDVGPTALDLDTDGNDVLLELEPYAGYENYYCLTTPRLSFLLGCGEPEMPTGAQWNALVNFMTKAEDALLSGDYEKVKTFFDVDSFARCYIVQELFKNVDYAVSSTRFYIKDNLLYEGPVWDFDLSSGNCSVSYYPDYNNRKTTGLSHEGLYCDGLYHKYLFTYDEFRTLVSTLYAELQPQIVNLYSENECGISQIDAILTDMRPYLARNAERWNPANVYSTLERKPIDGTYDAEVTFLRDWLQKRNAWLYDYYCTEVK